MWNLSKNLWTAVQKKPISWELTLLSIKGKNNFSRKVLLEPEVYRNGMFSQDRETDLRVPTEPKWPVKSLDIFFSIFRIIFLIGQSSYYKVYLKRLGALKIHLTCSADKPIHLASLTGTILYLVITQNSPLVCICPNCWPPKYTTQIWQDAY